MTFDNMKLGPKTDYQNRFGNEISSCDLITEKAKEADNGKEGAREQ
jgi:hypothetical protein